MSFRKPTVNLLDGKRTYCRFCKESLVLQEKEFPMKQVKGNKAILVKDNLYFCQSCHRYYITKQKSQELVHKYPGYYVDVSLYNIKPKRKTNTTESQKEKIRQCSDLNNQAEAVQANQHAAQIFPIGEKTSETVSTSNSKASSALSAKVFLSNTYATDHSICPFCNSVLRKELVNIPTINENGDFFRYYAESIRYCYKCRKAYITQKEVGEILRKINGDGTSNVISTVKFENVTVQQRQSNHEYLFSPTLDNTYALYVPGYDYRKDEPTISGTMDLNPQSFLGRLGYSVNKPENIRHSILNEAIRIYGKRKVANHLAFLISTRKGQANGEFKFARAISIWQADLNYIYKA